MILEFQTFFSEINKLLSFRAGNRNQVRAGSRMRCRLCAHFRRRDFGHDEVVPTFKFIWLKCVQLCVENLKYMVYVELSLNAIVSFELFIVMVVCVVICDEASSFPVFMMEKLSMFYLFNFYFSTRRRVAILVQSI